MDKYEKSQRVNICIRLPLRIVNELDKLVEEDLVLSRSEAIRMALITFLWILKKKDLKELADS